MSRPAKGKRATKAAPPWRPTELQLAVMRELNGAPSARADLGEVLRAVGARATRAATSPTVRSLVAQSLLDVEGEHGALTDEGRAYVGAACANRGSHKPAAGGERCVQCGARLTVSSGSTFGGEVEDALLRAGEVLADLRALSTRAGAEGHQAAGALARVAEANQRDVLETLASLRYLLGSRGAGEEEDRDASFRLVLAVDGPGPGSLGAWHHERVDRLVRLGYRLVDGPKPWRARNGAGRMVEAASVDELYFAAGGS